MDTDSLLGLVHLRGAQTRYFAVEDEEVADGTDKLAVVLERQISYFAEADTLEGFFQ